jgi:hypothetical protein
MRITVQIKVLIFFSRGNRGLSAKLLDMARAYMQFAFEFAQRPATITSPVEIRSVTANGWPLARITTLRRTKKATSDPHPMKRWRL